MARVFLNKQYSNYLGENRTLLDIVTAFTTGDTPTPPVFEFCIGNGFDDYTYSIYSDSNNKMVISGIFNFYQNHYSPSAVRVDRITGEVDTTFTSPFLNSSSGYNMKPSTYFSGKYYVGGNNLTVSQPTGFRRLNSDGSIDTTFSGLTAQTSTIQDFVELSDGSLIIVGGFTSINGVSRARIAKLNSNGSLNTTFQVGAGIPSTPQDIELSADELSVYVAGNGTSYSGISTTRLIKLDSTTGVLDNTFASGLTAFNSVVREITFDGNGDIWAVGNFTSYPNATGNGNGIAAVDKTTGNSLAGIGFGYGYEDSPYGLEYDSVNDRVIITSNSIPTTENSNKFDNVTFYGRVNAVSCVDGTLDTSFGSLSDVNYGFSVENPGHITFTNEILVDSNSDIFFVGSFTTFSGDRYDRLIKLDDTGQSITRTNC